MHLSLAKTVDRRESPDMAWRMAQHAAQLGQAAGQLGDDSCRQILLFAFAVSKSVFCLLGVMHVRGRTCLSGGRCDGTPSLVLTLAVA